ncbi:MAG TPA: NAD(P)H-binding protein, partial [Pyrinomonadaceae bacterium]|nr:NAD(P)H-binding protein [Pyrinomonadaceae bacterium]
MKIAITGGTGFIGRHLAERLAAEGAEVVLLARNDREELSGRGITFVASDLSDLAVLREAFAGCEAVAHCAGINREIDEQTYERVHVEGTRNVIEAAREAGVKKIALMSFLRARPNCGSAYHESKWAAEELLRASGLDYTIFRASMVYGRGDHMLDHLSHALHTFPIFAMVGLKEKGIRPLAIDDLVDVLRAALVEGRLTRQTVAITGAEELYLSEAVRRVARVTDRKVRMVRAP